MQILTLDLSGDWMPAIGRTVAILRGGGTAAFPTDTLYGLGCNALDPAAVRRVFDIKRRNFVKALPMFIRDLSWARELAYIAPEHERVMAALWPGKVTFVLPRRPIVPAIMSGGGQTIGLRAPDHPVVQALLQQLGYPIAGTSANLSGSDSLSEGARVIAEFAAATEVPDIVLDCGVLAPSEPSTVVDFSGPTPRIVRQGAVRADAILALL